MPSIHVLLYRPTIHHAHLYYHILALSSILVLQTAMYFVDKLTRALMVISLVVLMEQGNVCLVGLVLTVQLVQLPIARTVFVRMVQHG